LGAGKSAQKSPHVEPALSRRDEIHRPTPSYFPQKTTRGWRQVSVSSVGFKEVLDPAPLAGWRDPSVGMSGVSGTDRGKTAREMLEEDDSLTIEEVAVGATSSLR
jgi:hypothetical protein